MNHFLISSTFCSFLSGELPTRRPSMVVVLERLRFILQSPKEWEHLRLPLLVPVVVTVEEREVVAGMVEEGRGGGGGGKAAVKSGEL